MKWSISKAKVFSQCQRKWYYMAILAHHSIKNPLRRKAFLLKQLQSISAWRGSLVDKVIEKKIIPQILYGNSIREGEIIDYSMQLMEKQLAFGIEKKYLQPNLTKSSAGDEYCAFYDLKYNNGLDKNQLDTAKAEIQIALTNLIRSKLVKDLITEKPYLIAQRPLMYEFAGASISSTPDLIVFHKDKAPTIIDWKVHTFGNAEYWLQLGVYGLALSLVKPHNDFPKHSLRMLKSSTDFRLIEYQLLKNTQREYALSEQDLIDIEDYIFQSMNQMNRLTNGKKLNEIDLHQFQTARSPDICLRCQFKDLCWEDDFDGKN